MNRAWKSRVIRAAAKLLAVTVTATSCLSGMAFTAKAEGYGKNGIVRDMTSQQLVEDMGLGYNIGNMFDSIGSFITETDPWEYQKAWGNEPVSQLFLHKIKEAGFKTIRFPVSWAQWIDANNQINPAYIEAVRTVVDWCMDEDFYVILNIHHDGGGGDTAWIRKAATDWDGISAKYAAVWTQIAQNFNNYGDHLIFEGMNEVEFPDAPTKSRQFELMNAMNQIFVDSVRATGGNNAVRHLLIPGINTNIAQTCDRRYQMPSDPANHSILSIHYYSPPAFCVAEHSVDWAVPETTWGTDDDLRNVEKDLDMLAEHFISKGIPVIIGEYGVLTEDNKEQESIRAYVSKVPEIILQYGMCPILWDTSNAGDMKFVERVTGEFYDSVIKNNYLDLTQRYAQGQIQKKEFHFPEYQRVSIPITPGGWTSLESAFEPEKIVGIAFELDCASDWDSYGGGLYLDGWDNMPQWSFGSVYDEIVYMFSEEDKARLSDQLAVLIFWTDESKGGSRREELSIKGNQITLLYGENEQVHVPRLTTGVSSSSSGGSGGSGGGGGGGTSRYPNNSTNPVGGEANNERAKRYDSLHEGHDVVKEGMLKKGRNNKVSEEDTDTGAYKINIKDFCPDYHVGDTVHLYVSYLSDEGDPSIALVTTENGYTSSDDGGQRSGNTLIWDCTPPDGEVVLNLWYLGKNKYFMYKVSCEILESVPDFAYSDSNDSDDFELEQDVVNDDKRTVVYAYSLAELAEEAGVELGEDNRIKLNVYPVADADEGDEYNVYFEDVNGSKVTGSLTGSSVTLIGTPKDDKVYFEFSTKNIQTEARAMAQGFPNISFRNIVIRQMPAADILAEIVSLGRLEFSSTARNPRPIEVDKDGEEGVKVYFEYDGGNVDEEDLGGALVLDGNWDYTNDKWDVRSDANGR